MSVDFPSSYPANAAPVSKPVDLQTLQETFAAVLRSYGTGKGSASTNTMLEVLQTAQENNAETQKQERQAYQQRVDPNDVAQQDRKVQNKSEVRQGEMSADYQNQRDRHETLRNDYQEKTEQQVPQQPLVKDSRQQTADGSREVDVVSEVTTTLVKTHGEVQSTLQSDNHTKLSGQGTGFFSASQPSAVSNPAAAVIPQNPAGGLIPPAHAPALQAVPMNAFTIFTAAKRFGQSQDKQDDKGNDDENEESAEELPIKKPQPFAVFEAIQGAVKAADNRRQAATEWKPQNVPPKQTAEEREPTALPPNIKSLDELVNTSPNMIVPQKGESNPSQEQTQLFHRIAAACEAASQYAPIRIKVHLGHLGTMTLRFFYQADELKLHFETPTEESANFLNEHLEGLKTILSKRHVRLTSVEVFLTDNPLKGSE